MTEIEKKFKELKNKKEKALILYFTAGFPNFYDSIEIIKKCVKNGADIIEIGIPFSDPIADGPIIQYTSNKALENGMNTDECFKFSQILKKEIDIPCLFMTYFNPVYKYGIKRFIENCRKSGISGLIIPDLPFEESFEIRKFLEEKNMNLIYFLTPFTSEIRMKKILRKANGFIYFISLAGVTGPREIISLEAVEKVKKIRKMTNIPIAIGFGISKVEQIRYIKNYVDGIIVGSFLLQKIINGEIEKLGKSVKKFKNELRKE